MLVIRRKVGQCIQINDEVVLVVMATDGETVRVGINAPRAIEILRGELVAGEGTRAELGVTETFPVSLLDVT